MKKICQFCFLFTLLVVSCTPEEEDLFNKTAAERISETIQQNLIHQPPRTMAAIRYWLISERTVACAYRAISCISILRK